MGCLGALRGTRSGAVQCPHLFGGLAKASRRGSYQPGRGALFPGSSAANADVALRLIGGGLPRPTGREETAWSNAPQRMRRSSARPMSVSCAKR